MLYAPFLPASQFSSVSFVDFSFLPSQSAPVSGYSSQYTLRTISFSLMGYSDFLSPSQTSKLQPSISNCLFIISPYMSNGLFKANMLQTKPISSLLPQTLTWSLPISVDGNSLLPVLGPSFFLSYSRKSCGFQLQNPTTSHLLQGFTLELDTLLNNCIGLLTNLPLMLYRLHEPRSFENVRQIMSLFQPKL